MNKETLSTSETAKEAPKIKLALEEKYEEEKKNLTPEPEPLTLHQKLNQQAEYYFLKNL